MSSSNNPRFSEEKLRELVEGLWKKTRAREVNWKRVVETTTLPARPGCVVELPQSKVIVEFFSPPTQADFIRVQFARKDGGVVAEWLAEEETPDWELALSLFKEATRSVTRWDEILQDVEMAVESAGVIGEDF